MTVNEKTRVLQTYCESFEDCDGCPFWYEVGNGEHYCPIEGWLPHNIVRCYAILFRNDEIKPADDEIKFVKVEHEEAEAEERGRVTEKKIISTALHGYGADKQRVKCIEELAELQKEICKDLIGGGSQFHIAEEIADVEIVIAQMKIYYGCARDVAAIKAQKLKQLAKNLGMESDED